MNTSATILVVDDERIVAKDLQITLQRLGYSVPATAASGEEAVERCANLQPDLVLMDILMGGKIDGIEAAKQIRTRHDIPAIYLTAYADRTTLDRAKQTEPLGYLTKPYDDRLLRATIEMALFKTRTERQLRKSEAYKSAILNAALDGILVTDQSGAILETNPAVDRLFGWPRESLVGKPLSELLRSPSDKGDLLADLVKQFDGTSDQLLGRRIEVCGWRLDGTDFPAELSLVPIDLPGPRLFAWTLRDITARKEVEAAQARLIRQLHEALQQIKTLSGLLRMCANCKKICTDEGDWQSLEKYIEEHSDASITSSFCPECAHKLYPDGFPGQE